MNRLTEAVSNADWLNATNLVHELYDENKDNVAFLILAAEVYSNVNKKDLCFECISKGIQLDSTNYELFYMLGNYYADFNPDQAYLCYEMATYYVNNTDDEDFINDTFTSFKTTNPALKD